MRILITAGPTREKIDPVRFLTNYSSGKMGYALAEAAKKAGHKVVLISGPTSLPPVKDVKMFFVESADEMFKEVSRECLNSDVIIMSAAVADFTPTEYHDHKLKKSGKDNLLLKLKRTTDILSHLGKNRKKGQIIVGFAAESENILENAKEKLKKKKLDWIIANDITKPDQGFQADTNSVTIIASDGTTLDFPQQPKTTLASKIIQTITSPNYG